MHNSEEEKKNTTIAARPTTSSRTLITSFKPRQVILSSLSLPSSPMPSMANNKNSNPKILSSDNKVLLHQSICHFLELNGFQKSLKHFRREADVEKDSWKNCLLNLEEMCQKHLQLRKGSTDEVPDSKLKNEGVDHVTSVDTAGKAKENGVDHGEKSGKMLEDDSNGDNVKSKKKKKSKNADITSNHINGEDHLKDSKLAVEDNSTVSSQPVKKSKDKKKKHKHESEALDNGLPEKQAKTSEKADCVPEEEKSSSKSAKEDTPMPKDEVDKEKKASKKRKKSSSDDNDIGHVEETPLDTSKRRKTENAEQLDGTDQATTKTPKGSSNEVLEDGGEKSNKQNKTNERSSSAEPRSAANAFRRVKPEEVEFIDERLQDNSYWAKDGADSGYGAKAQEILGQVKGRGFRHEKTKKKRGSYRGGQIDLNSHSIKFNYDDDDE